MQFCSVVWSLKCCFGVQPWWVGPAWAMALCWPKGPVQRILDAQAEVSQRSVLTPSDLAQPSGHRDLLTLPPRSGWFLSFPANVSFVLVVAVAMAMNQVQLDGLPCAHIQFFMVSQISAPGHLLSNQGEQGQRTPFIL